MVEKMGRSIVRTSYKRLDNVTVAEPKQDTSVYGAFLELTEGKTADTATGGHATADTLPADAVAAHNDKDNEADFDEEDELADVRDATLESVCGCSLPAY